MSTRLLRYLLPGLIILTVLWSALGQQPDSLPVETLQPEVLAEPQDKADAPADAQTGLSLPEIYLAMGVLVFGLLLIVIEFMFMRRLRINADNSVRLITVTLIVVSILFLIVGSYSDQQIAPATGLLGTIAGYLLGKTNTSAEQSGE